jgi:hypothetical protein
MAEWVRYYNEVWLHSALKYLRPVVYKSGYGHAGIIGGAEEEIEQKHLPDEGR